MPENKSKMSKQFSQACEYYDNGQFRQAFKLHLKLARKGDASSMINLSAMYSGGYGAPRSNKGRAIYWLKKRIRNSGCDGPTLCSFGLIYLEQHKYSKAIKCFYDAGHLYGVGMGYLELGKIYFKTFIDYEKARKYLQLVRSSCSSEDEEEEADNLLRQIDEKIKK